MASWTVHLKGPKLIHHAGVAVGHRVYSFGGLCNNRTHRNDIEVYVFNTVSLQWLKLRPVKARSREHEVPSVRRGHTAVLMGNIYIWGGLKSRAYCNVLYAFDIETHRWSKPKVSGTIPGPRRNHSACVLGKVMFILGGFNKLNACTSDIYQLDTTTMVWSLVDTRGTSPRVLFRHSSTIIGTKMFVFGGREPVALPQNANDVHYNNTIKVFDTETDCWLACTPAQLVLEGQLLPEGREGHSAFSHNGELYIFGGDNMQRDEKVLNDLWKFNPETSSWKKLEPKGKSPDCSWTSRMCSCIVADRVILFGGFISIVHADDLYILDLRPSLKTLCKLAFIRYGPTYSELPHDIRWELAAMTTNFNKRWTWKSGCILM